MKLHENIRKIRKSKGFSQIYLAEALNITVSGYNMKESGKRPITTDELQIIAKALGEPIAYFFDDKFHEKLNNLNKEQKPTA